MLVLYTLITWFSLLYSLVECASTYRAAVAEFAPTEGDLKANVENAVLFISQAKAQGADIIVFPEIGINGYGFCSSDMLTPVPHPLAGVAPFLDTEGNYSEVLKTLSKAANDSGIYVVVNLAEIFPCGGNTGCSMSDYYKYNTNVVFDRSGVVIARYRKFHLFESGTDTTEYPEISFFDTDFGVRFGVFTCFDLMFDQPSLQLVRQLGIRDIVFPTAWFSEVPFLTAVQAQQMWAYTMDVNFLGSGYNKPSVGSGGSGIYRGRDGPIDMIFPDETTSKLIVADVPRYSLTKSLLDDSKYSFDDNNDNGVISNIHQLSNTSRNVKIPPREIMYLKKDNLTQYASVALSTVTNKTQVCHNDFCCEFTVKYQLGAGNEVYRYRAVAYDGIRTFDEFGSGGIQTCAIVICENDTMAGCGFRGLSEIKFTEIQISGTFDLKNALPMPSTLRDDLQLLPLLSSEFSFEKDCFYYDICNYTLTLNKPTRHLQTFGIYSRNFARDNEEARASAHIVELTGVLAVFAVAFHISSFFY